uniref:Amino acid transporter transmembrane domain-containing protein n=1 Tax=Ditylenchus dipsaci TaxID=166011 RepID=A0A915D3W5_9BILA
MAGRRLQNWTNRNVFVNSFDSHSDLPLSSYQKYGATMEEPEADPWKTPPAETVVTDSYQENGQPSAPCASTTALSQLKGVYPKRWSPSKSVLIHMLVVMLKNNCISSRLECDQCYSGNVYCSVCSILGSNIYFYAFTGLPFAVKVGGWSAVFALVWVAYVCYRTGISLIECMYEDGKKVRHSYREIAETVHPGLGKFVLMAQLTELASTCILYLVLAGDLLQGCVPDIDSSAWMMLVTAVLLGTAFLDDIRIVSHLSLANAVSHLVINAIIVLYCLSQMGNWSLGSVAIIPNMRLLPTVLGVVVFGYTSHIFLPSLENSMQDPKQFNGSIFGLIGFLTFAEFTQKEISNSLPNQLFKVIAILQELCLVLFAAYFHLKLKGDKLSEKEKRFNKFVIAMGIFICVVGVFFSALELRNAIASNAR